MGTIFIILSSIADRLIGAESEVAVLAETGIVGEGREVMFTLVWLPLLVFRAFEKEFSRGGKEG